MWKVVWNILVLWNVIFLKGIEDWEWWVVVLVLCLCNWCVCCMCCLLVVFSWGSWCCFLKSVCLLWKEWFWNVLGWFFVCRYMFWVCFCSVDRWFGNWFVVVFVVVWVCWLWFFFEYWLYGYWSGRNWRKVGGWFWIEML